MKKIHKFPSFRKVKKLQEALGQENIAMALDMIEEIRDEKKPVLSKNILSKLESKLIFILNNITLDKVLVTNQFKYLMKIVQDVMVDNNNIMVVK